MARPKKNKELTPSSDVVVATDQYIPPMLFGEEATASTFSRAQPGNPILNGFTNLMGINSPFCVTGDFIDCRSALELCEKAYWAYPLLRNVVEVMGELSNSSLILQGSNQKTRDFVEAWLEKINIWHLKEEFFREWFRSANCFIYKTNGNLQQEDINKMTQVYGGKSLTKSIPIKYTILNPSYISARNAFVFRTPLYVRILSPVELQKIRFPQTDEDKAFVKTIDPQNLQAIKNGGIGWLQLDPANLNVLLYKAQDYEPMGVPMAYGVIKDIEAKLELKRIDLSIARATDRALLLITVGVEPSQYVENGKNINYKTIAALQQAFQVESVARTLITDYSVKAEWLLPDINKILGPEKYMQLDKDINIGLNAAIFNENEKFANASVKVDLFIRRLEQAQQAFIKNFLQQEIINVCKAIGAKSYPTVQFEDLSLEDKSGYQRIAVALSQLGLLTPEELFETMQNGKLPLPEDSIAHQRVFKELRDEGLYMPLIGSSTQLQGQQVQIQQGQLDVQKTQVDNAHELAKQQIAAQKVKGIVPVEKPKGQPGRPEGSKAPKTNVGAPSPIGTSKASEVMTGYSLARLQEIVPIVTDLHTSVDEKLRKRFGLEDLTATQADMATMIVESIISNEPQDQWLENIDSYLEEPKELAAASAAEIDNIQIKHNIDRYTATLLRLAQKEMK